MKIFFAVYILVATIFGERKTQWSAVILAILVLLSACGTAI